MARGIAAAALFALAGCRHDGKTFIEPVDIEVVIERPEPAPPGALITPELVYETVGAKRARIDADAQAATATADPTLVAALDPAALARIAHFTDVQVREERGFLFSKAGTRWLDRASSTYIPTEGTKRDALQEANSVFVWLATVLTLNAIHAQRPVDAALHTGDAVDIGLRTELDHFLYAARRLDPPLLAVAGNHDILGFGIWSTRGPVFGARLDDDVSVRTAAAATFTANADRVILDRPSHASAFRAAVDSVGPHGPTLARFSSRYFGYDLGPAPDDLYYAVALRSPTAQAPGLRLIVLETSRDAGDSTAEMDAAQLRWLEDVLDAPGTRADLVIVAGHHPILEVRRGDGGFGPVSDYRTADALARVSRLLSHYPNVIAYLCGHTHLPEVVEVRDPATSAIQWVQVDSGSLLIHPQEASIIEVALPPGGQVAVRGRRFAASVDPASSLGKRVAEARAGAAGDVQSRPRYATWTSFEATRPLPAFPVAVPRFQ